MVDGWYVFSISDSAPVYYEILSTLPPVSEKNVSISIFFLEPSVSLDRLMGSDSPSWACVAATGELAPPCPVQFAASCVFSGALRPSRRPRTSNRPPE